MKILVVEDDEMVRGSLVDILNAAEYEVCSARNGESALQLLPGVIPDLIISDIMMPEMDGFTFLKEIQSRYFDYEIPFIFLSAKADTVDVRSGMNIGADDYLTKPFKAKDLLTAVRIRLEKKKRHQQALDEMALSIAKYVPHELRTPLVSILGYTGCLLDDYDSFTKNEIITMVSHIRQSGERLLDRIEKFITFADVMSSENSFRLNNSNVTSSFNIMDVIEEHSEYYAKRYSNLKFEKNIFDLHLYNDKHLISCMIRELIENACKFSPEKQNSTVIIDFSQTEGKFVLTISNSSGFQIPYARIEHVPILKQFGRDINQQIGNGLGLSIARQICDLLNLETEIVSTNFQTTIKLFFSNSQNNDHGGLS